MLSRSLDVKIKNSMVGYMEVGNGKIMFDDVKSEKVLAINSHQNVRRTF